MFISGAVGLSSLLLYAYLPDLLSNLISTQLVLKDGDESILYQMWVKTPVAVDYAYYFFQINNPSEVLRGLKPRVEEVGPFCFKQYRTKKVVGWSEDGETVKYLEFKNNIFAPEGEGCKPTLDEKVTVINPPIAALGATIADIVREKVPFTAVSSPIIMSAMSAFLTAHQQNMFMRRSVKEILLGFRVNLLDTVTTLIRPLEMIGYRAEDLLPGGGVPNNTFGLMYGRNNTAEGPYEVSTGKNSRFRFVHLSKYKGKSTLSFWKSQYCNQLRGSDGTMFGSGVKRSDRLWAFSADVCRSIYLTYQKDGEYKGIPTYTYGIDDTLFGSTDIEPKNECFCVHSGSVSHRCKVNGILDIGACQGGAPLIVTRPHYLGTDPDLSQFVEGLSPNKKDHDSVVEVEPLTGVAVYGMKKLQFSLRVENVPFLRGFSNMKNVSYIPFAYAVEKGGLPDDMADLMRNLLFSPLKFIYWGLLGGGAIALVISGRSGIRRLAANRRARDSVKQLRNSAKNLYKRNRNVVDSEVSSIKSKNSTTDLIPRSNFNDGYANTTNVKLQLRNNENRSNRFQQLSANRLMQPMYMNGQQMMQSYLPQIIPILPIMPFPYSMNNQNETNRDDTYGLFTNRAPMITNLSNSRPNLRQTSQTNNLMSYLPYNMYSFNYQIPSARTQTRANDTIYPNIYPLKQNNYQSENRESPVKIPEIRTSYPSNDNQSNAHENESFEDDNLEGNYEAENRSSSSASSHEKLNNIEYAKSLEDQFSYYNRNEHQPTSTNQNETLNDQDNQDEQNYDGRLLNELNDNHPNLASSDHLKPGHDQKKKDSIDEFNVMYEDFRKIKKLGYDYNYVD